MFQTPLKRKETFLSFQRGLEHRLLGRFISGFNIEKVLNALKQLKPEFASLKVIES